MVKIKNSYRVIQNNQNQGPISFQFSMKTVAYFTFLFFQLYCCFLYFLTIFFTLDLFLSAIPKGWKKSIGVPDPGLYAKSFEKKLVESIDVAISSHIISFRFPDISR